MSTNTTQKAVTTEVHGYGGHLWTATLIRKTKAGKRTGKQVVVFGASRATFHIALSAANRMVAQDFQPSTRGTWSVDKIDYLGRRNGKS